MSSRPGVACLFLFCAGAAGADGYSLGLGAEADDASGRALSGLAELALGEATWISGAAGVSRSDGPGGRYDGFYADVGIDRFFEPLGVRFAVAWQGDSDVLDSTDFRTSLYLKSDRASLSADYERRAYDLVIDLPLLRQERTLEFGADGFGLTGRVKAGENVSLYAGGIRYHYDDTASIGARDLSFLSLSRLVLAHGLLDTKAHAGVEIELGERSLDLRYARWEAILGQGRIDSIGVGWLTPIGGRSDLELRLSHDDSDEFGDSTVLSVFLYFYGP
jgi:hypothetical protein